MIHRIVLFVLSCSFILTAHGTELSDSSYEITGYHVDLRIYPAQNGIVCCDTITIHRITPRRDSIAVRFPPFYEVESLFVNGKESKFRAGEGIILLTGLPRDTVVQCRLIYSGVVDFHSEFSRITPDRAILRAEEFLPSSFGPQTIRSLRMAVTVPRGWSIFAPGDVVYSDTVDDSVKAVFSLQEPVPTIGWICAGKYRSQSDSDVTVSLFQDDTNSVVPMLSEAKKVLAFYSSRFQPYRFHDLKIVEVDDWVAGRNVLAIAVPSMILVKKLALNAETKFDRVEAILPHEIAHQWWPMTVFIKDEDAALLSEGMCEYSSLMFSEYTGKLSARDSLQHHPLLRPLLLRIEGKKDLPLRQKADLRSVPTHYLKSSFVHNMLRKIIGDSSFFRLYHEWAQRYALHTGTQDDFQHIAEVISRKRLDWFFDQWTSNRGVPKLKIYRVKSDSVAGGWITRGRVRLLGYEKYTTPVDVAVKNPHEFRRVSVWLGIDSAGVYHNDVGFEIRSEQKPLEAILDPAGDLLKIQKLPVKLSDLRDPGDGIMIVGTQRNGASLVALARHDSAEMNHAAWSITIKPDSEVTLADLQQERVIIYGTGPENSVITGMEGKFPYRLVHDSIRIRNESVYDSSLGLVQCIENPYNTQGLMVWIAPLSPKAHPELLPFESSWSVIRGKEEISSGTWEEHDEDLSVPIK